MKRMLSIGTVLLVLGGWGVAVTAEDGGHAYVGNKNCKKCHLKQFKSWEATPMAQAFESLKPGVDVEVKEAHGLDPNKDYTTDASCVGCHVTGLGQEGGFVDIASTPELAGVGCEACHGAGAGYTQEELMSLKNKEYSRADLIAAGMVHPVDQTVCVTCHNADSPTAGGEFQFNDGEGTHEHFPLKYEH